MASEIKVTARLHVKNGDVDEVNSINAKPFDQTAQGLAGGIIKIGTSEEDISLPDITTPGWCWLQNLDDTNYIEWGPKSGTLVKIGRLEPGEVAVLRLAPGVTLRAIADTAECLALVKVFED